MKLRCFDAERMCTIHNGVDADLFRDDHGTRLRVRAELGYTDDLLVCGMVARLVEAKGDTLLFNAVGQIV